jgi:large subunit ribosomal protein L4
VKASESEIVLVDELKIDEVKTRRMAEILQALMGENTVLVLIPENGPDYEGVKRACNNLENVKTLVASYLNIRDLLNYERVLVPVAALDVIESYLG